MIFSQIFKKFRLKSQFATLGELATALSEEGFALEDSTLSRWQNGSRVPTDRNLLLTIVKIFLKKKGMKSLQETNSFMELAGQGYLTDSERVALFVIGEKRLLPEESFTPVLVAKTASTEGQFDYLLSSVKESGNLQANIENQIELCYEKIYEGYPKIAYTNLQKLSGLMYELGFHKKQKGINLLSKTYWIQVRCLSDLTTANGFKQAIASSDKAYRFVKEHESATELGPAYWVKAAIRRLEILTRKKSEISETEARECFNIAKLALRNTPQSRFSERLVEHLEMAKIALILKDQYCFDEQINFAFSNLSKLSKTMGHFGPLVWDVKARGDLRFGRGADRAFESIQIAEQLLNRRYQAINLYVQNTKLQALLSTEDSHLIKYAKRLKATLALEAAILDNPYQELRLKQRSRFTGL